MSHLDNPTQWATGADPATEKQKAFIATLAASHDEPVNSSQLNKSEAAQKINELKNADADPASSSSTSSSGNSSTDPPPASASDTASTSTSAPATTGQKKQENENENENEKKDKEQQQQQQQQGGGQQQTGENQPPAPDPPIRDPATWTTGQDPATEKQKAYLAAMAQQAGEDVQTEGMGKGEASQRIGGLRDKTGM